MSAKMQSQLITLALAVAILLASCVGKNAGRQGLSGDDMRNLNHQVLNAANSSPDSAMRMIDSLKMSGTIPDYHCDYLRAKIYSQSLDSIRLDSAIIIGEQLMALDAVEKDLSLKEDVLEMLVNAYRQHGDSEQNI